jgi:hypothetical protein
LLWEALHRFADIIAVFTLPTALTGISMLEFGRRMPRLRSIFGWTFLAVGIILYAVDIADRFGAFAAPTPINIAASFGLAGSTAYMDADTSKIREYRDDHKIALIVYIPVAQIDSMTDTRIAKSVPYSITGDRETLSLNITDKLTEGVQPGIYSIDFYIALIPNKISENNILSLKDVEEFGGEIVGKGRMGGAIIKTPGILPKFPIDKIQH